MDIGGIFFGPVTRFGQNSMCGEIYEQMVRPIDGTLTINPILLALPVLARGTKLKTKVGHRRKRRVPKRGVTLPQRRGRGRPVLRC